MPPRTPATRSTRGRRREPDRPPVAARRPGARCPSDGVEVTWSAVAPVLVLIGGGTAAARRSTRCPRRRPGAGHLRPVHGGHGRHRRRRGHPALAAGRRTSTAVPSRRWPQSIGVDGFSVFATITICAAVILAALLLDGWLRREGMEGAEPYVLLLLSASGGVMMASANDLIVMFLGLEILSIAVYVLAAMHLRKITSQEAGVKYFVLGGVLVGVLPLRHRAHLRRHRLDEPRRDRRVPVDDRPRQQRAGARRDGAAARRVRLQGRGGAVPLLDPRRVPGRPDAERGVHGLGREGGRVRRAAAGLLPGLRHLQRRLAADHLRAGRGHDDRGVGAGRRADGREADARVLVDQPRRVHPRGGPGRRPRPGSRRPSSTWRPTRSWWPAASASSPSSAARATSATASTTTGGCPETAPSSPSRSRCSCSPRPACP